MALNIADLAEHTIDAVPDRVALICGDEQITFAELEEKANRLAHYLIDRGADPGVVADNGLDMFGTTSIVAANEIIHKKLLGILKPKV